jgi:hypothetical protein
MPRSCAVDALGAAVGLHISAPGGSVLGGGGSSSVPPSAPPCEGGDGGRERMRIPGPRSDGGARTECVLRMALGRLRGGQAP